MISIDNAVEITIKTYLGLPKRIRGSAGPSLKRLQEAGYHFPELLDLLEKFAKGKLEDLELGDIEVYHRLRNTLYHEGSGITIDPEYVDSYMQIAKVLLNNLLGSELKEDRSNPPTSLLGDLVLRWAILVREVRLMSRLYLGKDTSATEPVLHSVDRLVTAGAIDKDFRRRLRDATRIRNKLVHSVSIPINEEVVSYLTNELECLADYLHDRIQRKST